MGKQGTRYASLGKTDTADIQFQTCWASAGSQQHHTAPQNSYSTYVEMWGALRKQTESELPSGTSGEASGLRPPIQNRPLEKTLAKLEKQGLHTKSGAKTYQPALTWKLGLFL